MHTPTYVQFYFNKCTVGTLYLRVSCPHIQPVMDGKEQYFWPMVGSPQIWGADCVHCLRTFYIRDLSIWGFWSEGALESIPGDTIGPLHSSWVSRESEVIHRFLNVRWVLAPLTPALFKSLLCMCSLRYISVIQQFSTLNRVFVLRINLACKDYKKYYEV